MHCLLLGMRARIFPHFLHHKRCHPPCLWHWSLSLEPVAEGPGPPWSLGLWYHLLLFVVNCPCLCLELLNLRSAYFLRFWVSYGTSPPAWVGILENIWVSFMAHTTWEKFFSMRLPLIVQSHGGTSRHIQRGKNLFYTLPLDSAGLQLLHHVELVPRLKARFLREFATTPDNTWESGALALMFCYSLVFILVSLKFNPLIPWRFGIWPPFHNFLFLSDMEVFSSSFISFLVWLGVCLHNVIFQDVMEIMQRIMIILCL